MAASNPLPDLGAVKLRQQVTWASGDYAVIGATLQIVGETLCEAMDLRSGWRVLDVAAGNGNATMAAARRWCDVTSTDYVGALLDRARARAEADGFAIHFQEADVENLPFKDGEFDAVMSTFGVMFTPNQERAAAEMLRVCKPGGRIGMANWTPGGFVGQIFRCIGKYLPPPAGVKSPAGWGTEARLRELFGNGATIQATPRNFVFRYRSTAHWLDVFRTYYGPMHKAFAALDPAGQAALAEDLTALMKQLNRADDGTLVLPGEYLEVVVIKK
ncbi:MAG: class I SAM-dependent methyltransferase [Candidatus Acidiferrales bacterium]